MKVFCKVCKYYELCEDIDYHKYDIVPALHSCKFEPKPEDTYTDSPIERREWKDFGWADCEKKNKKNNCKDFKRTIW